MKNVDKNNWIGRRETDVERAFGMRPILLTASGRSYNSITKIDLTEIFVIYSTLALFKMYSVLNCIAETLFNYCIKY